MIKLKPILTMLTGLCVALAASAADVTNDYVWSITDVQIGVHHYDLDIEKGVARLTKAGAEDDTTVIPSSVEYEGRNFEVQVIGYISLKEAGEIILLPPTIKLFENNTRGTRKFKEVHVTDLAAFFNAEFKDVESSPVSGYGDKTGAWLVYNGEKITDLVVPDGVRKIGYGMFYNNWHLASLRTTSVEEIETNAFDGCKNLENVKLGSAIKRIHLAAFTSTDPKIIVGIFSP